MASYVWELAGCQLQWQGQLVHVSLIIYKASLGFQEQQESKPQCQSAFPTSACAMFVNVLLAKARHRANPDLSEETESTLYWRIFNGMNYICCHTNYRQLQGHGCIKGKKLWPLLQLISLILPTLSFILTPFTHSTPDQWHACYHLWLYTWCSLCLKQSHLRCTSRADSLWSEVL